MRGTCPRLCLTLFAGMLKDMRTLHEFRKRLAPFTENYTDAELEQLQREMESMAQLLLEIYLADKEQRGVDDRLPPRKMESKGRNLKNQFRG